MCSPLRQILNHVILCLMMNNNYCSKNYNKTRFYKLKIFFSWNLIQFSLIILAQCRPMRWLDSLSKLCTSQLRPPPYIWLHDQEFTKKSCISLVFKHLLTKQYTLMTDKVDFYFISFYFLARYQPSIVYIIMLWWYLKYRANKNEHVSENWNCSCLLWAAKFIFSYYYTIIKDLYFKFSNSW